jgi:hypothetical protein
MSSQQGRPERRNHLAMTLPQPLTALLDTLRVETALGVEIDSPADPAGEWWLDLDVGGMPTTVSWLKSRGFGLFTRDEDVGLGDRPDEIYREAPQASRRLLQLAAKWKASASRPPLGLRDVRHLVGGTQSAIAQSLGMDQAGVSRLEMRGDWKLSTLQDYVAAMGGVLELRVRFPNFEAPLGPADPVGARSGARAKHAA